MGPPLWPTQDGVTWPLAAVLGMMSGVGSGLVRDSLTIQIPTVLRSEIYAMTTPACSLIVVAVRASVLPPPLSASRFASSCA